MPCDDSCNCYVEADETRGLVSTGTGTADDPFVISPRSESPDYRAIPLVVASTVDLPNLPDSEVGATAMVLDTGLLWYYFGSGDWDQVVPDWAFFEDNGPITMTIDTPTLTGGFVLDGFSGWLVWAKGYADVNVEPDSNVGLTFNLQIDDGPTNIDSCVVSCFNADQVDNNDISVPFTLMHRLQLNDGDNRAVQVEHFITARPGAGTVTSCDIKNLRIMASRVINADLTVLI